MPYKEQMGKIADPDSQEFLKLYENGHKIRSSIRICSKVLAKYFRGEERRQMEIQKYLDIAPKNSSLF